MTGERPVLVGVAPPGFRTSSRTGVVGGASVFEPLVDALLRWELQREAGIRLTSAASPRVAVGAHLIARVSGVPAVIRCVVVAVVDEPDRKGFVVETVPGHALEGQEAFLLERMDDGVTFSVLEHSRPQAWVARLPGARIVQRSVLNRYVPAARRLAERVAAEARWLEANADSRQTLTRAGGRCPRAEMCHFWHS